MTTNLAPAGAGTRGSRRGRAAGRPCVLEADVFRRLLVVERKRSERSSHAFVLLLVRVPDWSGLDAEETRAAVLDALTAAKRETDILGWFEPPSVVGAILPEIRMPDVSGASAAIAGRVRHELARRLPPGACGALSIELHAYPESRSDDERGAWPVDAVLHPDLPADHARRRLSDGIKRAIDVAGSLLLLVGLSPLLVLIAALVRLTSPGPVLFRQVRIGQMVRPFTMLKFRSMYAGNDPKLHQEYVSWFIGESRRAPASNGNGSGNGSGLFKLTGDLRVTPLGRFLRKTSLDELPQLWNVLRGDMSLVGPRPPLPYELEQYEPWHRRRILEAKPGITGLWQVVGRSRTTFDEMVRLDLRYARTRSLWTDVKILLATPAAAVSGKGAC